MKTKLDQPHLTPLRYDYKLLHDCYASKQDSLSAMQGCVAGVLIGAGLWGVIVCAVLWLIAS